MATTSEWIMKIEDPKIESLTQEEKWGIFLNQKIPALPSDENIESLRVFRRRAKKFQGNIKDVRENIIKNFGNIRAKEAIRFLEIVNSLIVFQTIKIVEHFEKLEKEQVDGMPEECLNFRMEVNINKCVKAIQEIQEI